MKSPTIKYRKKKMTDNINEITTDEFNQKAIEVKRQDDTIFALKEAGSKARFIAGQQFFDSMRSSGYSHEGEALCDILDNSIQAGASQINIFTNLAGGNNPRSPNTINDIAVFDNGHGMNEEFLRLSIGFGATSRGKTRDGLGRFGMGLSTAGIAFSPFLQVLSKRDNSDYLETFIDLRKGSPTEFTDKFLEENDFQPPKPEKSELPEWLLEKIKHLPDGVKPDLEIESGTVVILSDFERERRKWALKEFHKNLMTLVGITYYRMAGSISIFVNDQRVEFIDPLFQTPGLRGFDLDEDRAEILPSCEIELKDEDDNVVDVATARFSVFPPTFGLKQELKAEKGTMAGVGKNANSRFSIMKEYTGVLMVRNDRIISVDRKQPVIFGNNDYNIGVELSFAGSADELFGITSKKNQVSLRKGVVEALDKMGLPRGINSARKRRNELFKTWTRVDEKVSGQKGELIRPFEKVAGEELRAPRKKLNPKMAEHLKLVGEKNLDDEVKRQSRETGETESKITEQLSAKIVSAEFKVVEKSLMGAEFVTFHQMGGQTQILINTDHRFYKDLFGHPDNVSPYGREALGCMMISFFRALTQTQMGEHEGGKYLFDSITGSNFMRTFSETFGNHLERLETIYTDKEIDTDEVIEDISEPDQQVS